MAFAAVLSEDTAITAASTAGAILSSVKKERRYGTMTSSLTERRDGWKRDKIKSKQTKLTSRSFTALPTSHLTIA